MTTLTLQKTKKSVLIIDDEPGLRDMLVFGLTDLGYDVQTASNGAEGLEKVRHNRFDLAVCDVMMPGIGGVDVLKGIKDIQPEIDVIMTTGYATLETAIESMKRGAFDYIAKPYVLDQLNILFDKALERRQLKAQVGQLEEVSRLKSALLANMGHELRTPMNAILGYASLLLDGSFGGISEQQNEAVRRIETNARSLLLLINNILDLSKLNAGRMPLYIERCDVKELIDEVFGTIECLAKEKKLSLIADVPEHFHFQTDKAKLKQILINLLGNAIKFTSEGQVAVRVERLTESSAVQIHVHDSGIGIRAEDMPFLFEEFRQLDGSATKKYEGTGLGLSICRKLAELMGGSVSVKSSIGTGSTFTVTLPRLTETRNAEGLLAGNVL